MKNNQQEQMIHILKACLDDLETEKIGFTHFEHTFSNSMTNGREIELKMRYRIGDDLSEMLKELYG